MGAFSAIFVSYNSRAVIAAALDAVLPANPQSLFVVDNASTDGTAAWLREQYPHIEMCSLSENIGYGGACNLALEKVTTPYALLVNPDAIIDTRSIDSLIQAAERYPDAAILAPVLRDGQGTLHKCYKRNVFDRERGKKGQLLEPSGDLCADFLSGAVWLLNMERMRKVGFFDPAFFLFYEDDDLCLRTRRAGYACVLVGEATATHAMGESSAFDTRTQDLKQSHLIYSRLLLEQKYRGKLSSLRKALFLMAANIAKLAFSALFSPRKAARYRARLTGLSFFFGNYKC